MINDNQTHLDTKGMPELPSRSSFKASGQIVTYILLVKKNMPTKNSFHICDGSSSVFLGATTNEEAIPDAPRMSPLKRRSAAAERPMRQPPTRPVMGVK
jgi:hypothetical protein